MSLSSPGPRAAIALLLFSAWMGLLFAGWLMGGALHLLLVGALALFPWRALPPPAGVAVAAGGGDAGLNGDADAGAPPL